MYSSFYRMDARVRKAIANKNYCQALDDVRHYVTSVMNEQSTPGEVVGSKKLDDLCELIGKDYVEKTHWSRDIDKLFKANLRRVVIVCTGLYRYGGTSLLISDIAQAHPDAEISVLATNALNDMTDDDLKMSRIGNTDCVVKIAKQAKSSDKMEWLIEQIVNSGPSRIYILNHHQDSVIISAVHPFVDRTNVLFYHHADYNICLGVHMSGAIHIDPHNVGYFNCREKELISDNVYVPMMVSDRSWNRVDDDFIQSTGIRTCSSGTFHKFRNFYLYPYVELIADRLKVRDGVHYHIGSMSDGDIASIYGALSRKGVEYNRFIHIPWTSDLWHTVIEKKIDLFIASFPIGGARTSIEMMGAGIPHLMPQSYLSRFYSSRDIAYPDHYVWKYPEDFIDKIMSVTAESLSEHAKRARAHYLLHYCTETLDIEDRLNQICMGNPTSEPYALYPHEPDHLDRALHFAHLEHHATANTAFGGSWKASVAQVSTKWPPVRTFLSGAINRMNARRPRFRRNK